MLYGAFLISCLISFEGDRPLARLIEMLQQVINANGISSMCIIGEGTVFLHHGLGCVAQKNTKIGNKCRIFSNVVIGEKWSDCIIGANAVVIKSVPDRSLVLMQIKYQLG